MQREALGKYAERKGLKLAWFEDRGSGADPTRPQLEAMMVRVRQGEFDRVIVWKLDRLARSVVHAAQLIEELNGLGVAFVSYTEALDTNTPMGKAMLNIAAVFAQLERDIITERNRAMQEAARARGKHIGRPPKYSLDESGQVWRGKECLGPLDKADLPKSTKSRLRRRVPKDPPPLPPQDQAQNPRVPNVTTNGP